MTQPPSGRPDGQPPLNWRPTPLGSAGPTPPSVDPTRPLGAARPDSTSIGQFAPPRSKAPWFIGLAVVLAAALIGVSASLPPGFFGQPGPSSSPSPTPSRTQALPGHPFTTQDGSASGRWEIRDHRWTADGVQLEVWLAVDEGTLGFSFVAFNNTDADAQVIYPAPGADYPALGGSPIRAGEERSGWLLFPAQRGDLTVILADDVGQQISALVVAG